MTVTLADIADAVAHTRKKHGEGFIGNLPDFGPEWPLTVERNERAMRGFLQVAGACARWANDNGYASEASVLVEEVA